MKTKLSIVTLIAALALGSPVFAAGKKKEAAAPAASAAPAAPEAAEKKVKGLPFKGKIASVDAAKKTFTVEAKEGTGRTFSVPASAKIMKADGSTVAAWDDLKVGEEVRGSYTKAADGTLEIAKVKVGPKPAGEEPSKEAKKEAKPVKQ